MSKKIFQYIQEIQECLEELEKQQKCSMDDDILVAFRGEPRDYGDTKLVPSLFRNPNIIPKEAHIFELISDYGILSTEKERLIDKAIESQHYVAISRMLDITFSILPALYFACGSGTDVKQNGKLFVFCFPERYSPHSAYLEAFYKNVLIDKTNITYSKNFKVITHSYSNERIQAQSGGFIFFPGEDYIPISPVYYKEILIKAEDKEGIMKDLSRLFNVEEATLFPEKSTRAKLVKKILMNEKYVKRELSVEDEVSTYFERIFFETEMMKQKGNLSKKDLMRKLRKEKADLLTYINTVEIPKNEKTKKQEQIVKIEETFAVLGKMC